MVWVGVGEGLMLEKVYGFWEGGWGDREIEGFVGRGKEGLFTRSRRIFWPSSLFCLDNTRSLSSSFS